MILCDVNVLIFDYITHSKFHQLCRKKCDELREMDTFYISEIVLAAVVRIVTNPKVFKPTPSTDDVFGYVNAWRRHPNARVIRPGERHFAIFQDLVMGSAIRGSDTTDAYLAALAIEHGCKFWTMDSDFKRFPGLGYTLLGS